jgi:hypothetical protein
MVYAQNAFGVTSFGESTEPTDVIVTLTGVSGSIDVNGAALGVASISRVIVSGVESTLQVGTVGIGMGVVPTGVSATGAIDDGITFTLGTGVTPTITGVSATGNITDADSFSTFTAEGNAQLSTAQQKFGTASLLLDGTNDYVESDSNIDLSSGDFTVDMWIRPDNVTGYKGLFQSGTSSLLSVYLIGNQVQGTVAGSTTLFISDTRVSANVWTMITVEREGNVHRLYINGTLEESSSTANRPDNGTFTVGKNSFGDFDGYIDEVRLSNVAQYTGTGFTPRTSAFTVDDDTLALLHFDGTNASTDIVNAANLAHINVSAGFGPTVTLTGFGLQGITDSPLVDGDEVIITSDADVSLDGKGVSGTGAVDTVTLDCQAVVVPTGVQGTFTVGDETIDAVQFDYESIKDDYSRQRTVYISAASSNTNTSYVRAA